jgi:hypothetical protein
MHAAMRPGLRHMPGKLTCFSACNRGPQIEQCAKKSNPVGQTLLPQHRAGQHPSCCGRYSGHRHPLPSRAQVTRLASDSCKCCKLCDKLFACLHAHLLVDPDRSRLAPTPRPGTLSTHEVHFADRKGSSKPSQRRMQEFMPPGDGGPFFQCKKRFHPLQARNRYLQLPEPSLTEKVTSVESSPASSFTYWQIEPPFLIPSALVDSDFFADEHLLSR